MILLDTCALLWLAHDRTKISRETQRLIDQTPVAYISAITSFEIGIETISAIWR